MFHENVKFHFSFSEYDDNNVKTKIFVKFGLNSENLLWNLYFLLFWEFYGDKHSLTGSDNSIQLIIIKIT